MKHANVGFVLHHRERIHKEGPRFSFPFASVKL